MTEIITSDELTFRMPARNQIKVPLKPLSVNEAWKGRRFKTDAYKSYEKHMLLILPKLVVPPGKLKIILEFGMSNAGSDIDNPVKMTLDILQKKYWFNDSQIYEMTVSKVKVAKGDEYTKFEFISLA